MYCRHVECRVGDSASVVSSNSKLLGQTWDAYCALVQKHLLQRLLLLHGIGGCAPDTGLEDWWSRSAESPCRETLVDSHRPTQVGTGWVEIIPSYCTSYCTSTFCRRRGRTALSRSHHVPATRRPAITAPPYQESYHRDNCYARVVCSVLSWA